MAIRFRCIHCDQLMSIASRKAGQTVPCPTCRQEVTVPDQDELSPEEASAASSPEPPAELSQPFGKEDLDPQPPFVEQNEFPEFDIQDYQALFDNDDADAASVTVDLADNESDTDEDEDDDGFTLRSPKSDFGEMDLTPMVDVTFLLLIFFMVTASFDLQKSIEVPSPDPDNEGATQSIQTPEDLQENSIIVQIDERDVISIDYEPVDDPENLADLLADRRRLEGKHELIIDADERAKHGTVVFVNDAAVEADFQRIRLAVRGGG